MAKFTDWSCGGFPAAPIESHSALIGWSVHSRMRRRAIAAEYSATHARARNTATTAAATMTTAAAFWNTAARTLERPEKMPDRKAPPSRIFGRPIGLALIPPSMRVASMRARRSEWCSGLPHTAFASRRS